MRTPPPRTLGVCSAGHATRAGTTQTVAPRQFPVVWCVQLASTPTEATATATTRTLGSTCWRPLGGCTPPPLCLFGTSSHHPHGVPVPTFCLIVICLAFSLLQVCTRRVYVLMPTRSVRSHGGEWEGVGSALVRRWMGVSHSTPKHTHSLGSQCLCLGSLWVQLRVQLRCNLQPVHRRVRDGTRVCVRWRE